MRLLVMLDKLCQLKTLFTDAKFSKIMLLMDMNMCNNIIVPALKWLSLCIDQENYHNVDLKVLIDSPVLKIITLVDDCLIAFSVMRRPSLVDAILYVCTIELIKGLSNVNSLEMSEHCFCSHN